MVIYEPSPCGLVHLGVGLAIDLLEQETFKDIETHEEIINEDDADNERAERGKPRDRLHRYMRNVGRSSSIKVSFNCQRPWRFS